MNDARDSLPLLKGTLDLLCLKALSVEPTHGYGVASWLEQQSGGALGVDDSAIYQSLRRLENKRMVDAEWRVTENKRRARYYRLTERGRERLRAESETWGRYARTVSALLALGQKG